MDGLSLTDSGMAFQMIGYEWAWSNQHQTNVQNFHSILNYSTSFNHQNDSSSPENSPRYCGTYGGKPANKENQAYLRRLSYIGAEGSTGASCKSNEALMRYWRYHDYSATIATIHQLRWCLSLDKQCSNVQLGKKQSNIVNNHTWYVRQKRPLKTKTKCNRWYNNSTSFKCLLKTTLFWQAF